MNEPRLVIDPGHGGKMPGLVLHRDGEQVIEAEANLASALTLKYLLVEGLGFEYPVVLTRTKDESIPWGARYIPATLAVAIHYDIPNGGKPIYHQRGRCDSYYVAERLRLLTGKQHPVWSTERAKHTGGRLYIDNTDHIFVLWEVDTLDNYRDDPDWRINKLEPIAAAIKEVFDEVVRGL